jgi:hypothetical protein
MNLQRLGWLERVCTCICRWSKRPFKNIRRPNIYPRFTPFHKATWAAVLVDLIKKSCCDVTWLQSSHVGPNVEVGLFGLAVGFRLTRLFILVGLGVVFGQHKTRFIFLQVHEFNCIKCTILQPLLTPIKTHSVFHTERREPQAAQKIFTIFVVPHGSDC